MLRGEASIATKKNVPLHVAELDTPLPQKKAGQRLVKFNSIHKDQKTDLMQQVYWSTLVRAIIEPVWERLPWSF